MAKTIDNLNDQRVKWIPFSDQVMGGISEVNFFEKEEDGLSFYHMEGMSVLRIMEDLFNLELK